jgi:3-phenylpropionate/trans-cinnamate dioxygenase ferredoxin subunit
MSLADDRFFAACPQAEMKSGDRRVFELAGQPVLLLMSGKQIFAIRNRCTHLDFTLDQGRQIGCEIICRRHGARFDLRTGRAVSGPAVRAVAVYETRINAGVIEIGIPEVAANPAWPY